MISILLGIGALLALVAGVAYVVYQYAPYVIGFFNSITLTAQNLGSFLPSWLAPFVVLALAIAVVGFLVKVL